MVWTFLQKSAKVDFRASKTLKVWILCRSHCGNSYIKVFTIHGFVALPMGGKPLCSLSTTLALRYSLQNWWLNSAPGMWTWTSWRHTNRAPGANASTRKKLRNTWPRKSPNLCNRGYRRNRPPTTSVNNAFWNWKLNWPRSNRRIPRAYWTSSTGATIRFYIFRSFLLAGVPSIRQALACGERAFLADRDAIQEMAERLETPFSQNGNVGKAVGEGHNLVEQPT